MRKAVYLFLLALLLLELVTVEGKCIPSCESMTRCADFCNKCTSTRSCASAERICKSAKAAVKCVPSTIFPRSVCGKACKGGCSPSDEDCLHCRDKGYCDVVSKCQLDCATCIGPRCKHIPRICGRFGLTLSCPQSTSSRGMADIFDMDWDETDEIPGVEPIESTNGLIAFKLTKPALISVAVLMFLLVINISCLFYNKCIKNGKDKKIMYAKVAAIASSDDDMENLQRVEI